MPNRYIREGIITSESVNALSFPAESFFRRLLNRVDDYGRYTAHPTLLLGSLFPLHIGQISPSDISGMLEECQRSGVLFMYENEGKRFLVVNKWERARAKRSKYPEPPEDIRKRMKTYAYPKDPPADAPDSGSGSASDANSGSNSASVSAGSSSEAGGGGDAVSQSSPTTVHPEEPLPKDPAEHAAYRCLVTAYVRNQGPLQDNDQQLASIAGVSQSDWFAMRPRLAKRFQVGGGLWRHEEIDSEFERRSKGKLAQLPRINSTTNTKKQ